MAICFQIANRCTRWRCSFQGLSLDGKRADFSETSAPLSLIRPSALSTSLDSTVYNLLYLDDTAVVATEKVNRLGIVLYSVQILISVDIFLIWARSLLLLKVYLDWTSVIHGGDGVP